jgi:hypothetical protein
MDRKDFLATLARLTSEARQAEVDHPSGSHAAVLRSLKATYLAFAAGLPLPAVAADGFRVDVTARGAVQLFQGECLLPTPSTYLQFVFRRSGITLPPGHAFLLDAELAKEAIEDSLWSIGLQQAVAERRRTALLRALAEGRTLGRAADLEVLRTLEASIDRLSQMKVDLVAASLAADTLLDRRLERVEPDTEVA